MKKFAVVILAMTLLMTFAAVPVMAKSPNKVPATAVITGITGYEPDTIVVRMTDDGIWHMEYFKMWGTINLYLDGGPAIPVQWVDICEGLYNPVSNTGVYRFDEVWTLPDGTFVGTDKLSMEGNVLGDYTGMHTHIVLQGSPGGVYEGQLINLWFDTFSDEPYFVGFWLKP